MDSKFPISDDHVYAQLIAKAWSDDTFKSELIKNPRSLMSDMGINVPEGVDIQIVEDTPQKVHLVIPSRPSKDEMNEIDLNKLTWAYESNSSGPGSLC